MSNGDLITSIQQIKALLDIYKKFGLYILVDKITHHLNENDHLIIDVPYFNTDTKELWRFHISKAGTYTFDKWKDW